MRDRSSFFLIHVYKNMGTTLYSQFPRKYNLRFYGQKTMAEWEKGNRDKFKGFAKFKSLKSIDHLRIDELVRLGILDEEDIQNRKFIALIREPIERFISICNFKGKNPDEFIQEIIAGKKYFTQCDAIKTSYAIDLTLILMEEKELIQKWFLDHSINLNLSVKKNVSKKTITTLTESQIKKVKELFKDDFELYDKLKESSGMINIKDFTHASIT